MIVIDVQHVPLDDGGYTEHGHYYGAGDPLWYAYNDTTGDEGFFRAEDAKAAEQHVRALWVSPRDLAKVTIEEAAQ